MKDVVCPLVLMGVALAATGCGGGGGGRQTPTEPTCVDQGVTVSARITPMISQCTTANVATVTVSNQSCNPLVVDAIQIERVQVDLCPGGDPQSVDLDTTVGSKQRREIPLEVSWCCTRCSTFSCEFRYDLVIETTVGAFPTSTATFTKNFSEVCEACAEDQGTGPAMRAVAVEPR